MALQLNLPKEKTTVKLAAPTAYARIVQVLYNADTGAIEVAINIYADADAAARPAPGRSPESAPIGGGVIAGVVGQKGLPNIDDTMPGMRAVLYGWLKTLPEFAGSKDV